MTKKEAKKHDEILIIVQLLKEKGVPLSPAKKLAGLVGLSVTRKIKES